MRHSVCFLSLKYILSLVAPFIAPQVLGDTIMAKDIHGWIARVDAARPAMIELAATLQQPDITVQQNVQLRNLCSAIPFIAMFAFEDDVTVHIFFQFMDHQTDSDVVITNMTTLHENTRSNGFGSKAMQLFLAWAKQHNLHEIRAAQVADPRSQRFWIRNGFTKDTNPNPCTDFLYQC